MNHKIAIIGLGYVGLPLAVEFGKKYPTIGFDIDKDRVDQLNSGNDYTLEISNDLLQSVLSPNYNSSQNGLFITTESTSLKKSNTYIVTVPTPIDINNRPVLTLLIKASETVGKNLKKGDYVIFESTVYPGATEEVCVPILEKTSGLVFNKDFFCGYSPERINPGDKNHTLSKILKVTSGSTPETAEKVDQLYKSIISAGTYKANSIKVAESAKVIENSQRDINIAFVNELAKIFNLLEIDTQEVLQAAETKWNFLPFKPGLVGGHCIGVDPYYLAQKAQEKGYRPEIILAGRKLNDSMGKYVAGEMIKLMIKKDIKVKSSDILMLGITFKENCPDIRNSRAIDVYHELQTYDSKVDVYDPWASKENVMDEYNVKLLNDIPDKQYDGIILVVAHKEFKSINLEKLKKKLSVIYDVKGCLPISDIDARL